MNTTIRVVIADDHELVRRGLRMTIAGEADITLCGEATNGREAVALVAETAPDVLLLDARMPEMSGIDAAEVLSNHHPDVAIIMLTNYSSDPELFAALRAGVAGYLLKEISGDALLAAIRGAAQGRPQLHPEITARLVETPFGRTDPLEALTPRERDVLRLLAHGLTNREIGAELTVTEATVKGYVSEILSKLQVSGRTQAALVAIRYGLVSLDEVPRSDLTSP